MNELMADVRDVLNADPRLASIQSGGGVIILPSIDEWQDQQKTPCIALVDPGGHPTVHLSSYTVDRRLNLEVWVVQKTMTDRDTALIDVGNDETLEALVRVVRKVLDMNRMHAKYAHAQLSGEGKPTSIRQGMPQLLGKPLIFEYRRIESP